MLLHPFYNQIVSIINFICLCLRVVDKHSKGAQCYHLEVLQKEHTASKCQISYL